jgi:hypothetical protein
MRMRIFAGRFPRLEARVAERPLVIVGATLIDGTGALPVADVRTALRAGPHVAPCK